MNLSKDIRRALIVAKGVAAKVVPRTPLAYGGRSNENSPIFWHGSPSGDLRGAKNGLHLGTRAAAEDALNARIGFPAEGHWDGTRKYGETRLAGKKNLRARGPYLISGHNMDAPEHDYMPHEHPDGLPNFSDKSKISPDHKPSIKAYKIVGPMTNTPSSPHDDYRANGYMSAAIKRGNAKSGYYYNNQGEDSGSISAVVPSAAHIAPVGDDKIAKADGGAVDGGTDAQPPDEPIFHSALEQGIAGAKQQSASPQDWKAITSKLPGVRQEEIDYSGLHDMLDQQQGQVPRDALLRHVRANPAANVQEVWKGKGVRDVMSAADRAEYSALHARFMDDPEKGLNPQECQRLNVLGSAASLKLNKDDPSSHTKYHTYQTPGGVPGSYKELLLTLPPKKNVTQQWKVMRNDGHVDSTWSHEHGARQRAGVMGGDVKRHDDIHTDGGYKTRHWDEPNILAHVRMHDRTGPNGEKLLHIEEVQSDWHQEGREKGYASNEPRRQFFVKNKISGNVSRPFDTREEAQAFHQQLPESARANTQMYEHLLPKNEHRVPDAPFKDTKDWAALAMKRVIRHAADNGYRGITWTTGDQQADRYDLSKQIDRVYHRKNDDGTYEVEADPKNGGDKVHLGDRIKPDELASKIGKDVAEKITNGEGGKAAAGDGWKFLKGVDLKVGGEGMREFYDRILPSVVNKIAKPHGVQHDMMQWKADNPKHYTIMPPNHDIHQPQYHLFDDAGELVDSSLIRGDLVKKRDQLREAENLTLHHLPITPSMRGKSHKLFNTGGAVKVDLDHALKLARKATGGPTDVTTQAVKATEPKPKFVPHNLRNVRETTNPKRLLVTADGPGGVKGIVVPKHMLQGNAKVHAPGMNELNEARAKVYGGENRDPLTVGKIGEIHKKALDTHFQKPLSQQLLDENAALTRLRQAKHIAKDANTLDASEKLDTVNHERDDQGRGYVAFGSKGTAGHALYTSGYGANEKHHVLNTCPGQTGGCGGGVDKNGIVDTMRGTCFAPNAESQYAGSIRGAAQSADRQNKVLMIRPNIVDESDRSTRDVLRHLNKQRVEKGKPKVIANSYGKTTELHDPENGYYVTYSNAGPKTKFGTSIAENVSRDKTRVRSTITAADAAGNDFKNEGGNLTPPKNSYMVTDVQRYSPLDKQMQKAIKHAKYWSAPRSESALTQAERAEGPEGHFGPDGEPTTPEKAHFGHTTLNGKRYDYQKQHILHPRLVQVGKNPDGSPHMIPTDSRFKDDDFLPKNRFMTKNGKKAGAILLTTPTTSTSGMGRQTSFTHHINEGHVAHAKKHGGEHEIDPPHEQEASAGNEYNPPAPVKTYATGGAINHAEINMGLPEQSFDAQRHNAHRAEEHHDH